MTSEYVNNYILEKSNILDKKTWIRGTNKSRRGLKS